MFDFLKRNKPNHKDRLTAKVEELSKQNKQLSGRVQELQVKYNNNPSGNANPYQTKKQQVKELLRKFNNKSDYGCELIQRICALKAAFSMPNGVQIEQVDKSKGEAEKTFAENLLSSNNLDADGAIKTAIELTLQGSVAFALKWEDGKDGVSAGGVSLKYLSWNHYQYEISSEGFSNLKPPFKLAYDTADNKKEVFNDPEFAFITVGDRLGNHNGNPPLGVLLNIFEHLSQDLYEWRQRNQLFGFPTPSFEAKEEGVVDALNDYLEDKDWRIGDAIAHVAKLVMVEPNSESPFKESITTLISLISAVTGISPHFLGFPELLKNRSTADSMGEANEIVSSSEIKCWEDFYDDVIDKSIAIRNAKNTVGNKLDSSLIKASCGNVSDRQWNRITEVWLEVLKEGGVSVETFLEKLPDVDKDEEMERLRGRNLDTAEAGSGEGNKSNVFPPSKQPINEV